MFSGSAPRGTRGRRGPIHWHKEDEQTDRGGSGHRKDKTHICLQEDRLETSCSQTRRKSIPFPKLGTHGRWNTPVALVLYTLSFQGSKLYNCALMKRKWSGPFWTTPFSCYCFNDTPTRRARLPSRSPTSPYTGTDGGRSSPVRPRPCMGERGGVGPSCQEHGPGRVPS